MKSLYVIGNGFDLHHDIKSSYGSFRDWLSLKDSCLLKRIQMLYLDKSENEFWNHFESSLGEIHIDSFMNNYYSNLIYVNDEDVAIDFFSETEVASEMVASLYEIIISLMCEWLNWILNSNKPNTKKIISINKNDAFFISFNYTNTLEMYYGVPRDDILYIHGCAIKNDNLIFGHNKTSSELKLANESIIDELDEDDRQIVYDAIESIGYLYKDVNAIIERNSTYFKLFSDVNEIYVYGLSFSAIDLPYIEHIISITKHNIPKWQISYYSNDELLRIREYLASKGILNVSYVKLSDLVIDRV